MAASAVLQELWSDRSSFPASSKREGQAMLMDLSQSQEGRRGGERGRGKLSNCLGPKFTGPSHLQKGWLGTLGSALFAIRRPLSGISFVSFAPGLGAKKG